MDFRKATDDLFGRIDHEMLAKQLGVSTALIRQARLKPGAAAHRSPPEGWEKAVAELAEKQAEHYRKLAAMARLQESECRA